jgi:hypothetical protein
MGKLNSDQIEEFFSEHLPYKYGMLLAHAEMCRPGPWKGDPAVLNACFVASLVTGRLFLNFLGVKRNAKDDSLQVCKAWDDDVSSVDLGGTFVDIGSLPPRDVELFTGFLKMADKAAAHFSRPEKRPWEDTHEAIDRIVHHLTVHLNRSSPLLLVGRV